MLRIKATKTSLYKLTAEYIALPGIRRVNFQKATRHQDYWLKWHKKNTDGYCDAFLLSSAGCPLLVITERDIFGNRISRTVHRLTVDNLRERDMIEDTEARAGAAGICPGGCLHNYADPLPHCPGCAFRCPSHEIGGADNGVLAPAT